MADLKLLAEEWPAISRRLDEALALAPDARAGWLDALAEPESMRRKLGALLADAADVETDDFLGALPRLTVNSTELADASAGGEDAGAVIGPYRLIRELGVGGMGRVWLAERFDGGLKRPVALKLPRLSGSRELAERMGRERDILASLDHPNIARIYDAGVDIQGRPYLALEYVEGEPIDAYCERLALPLPARLALLLQVARAVAHAHARLVVHRDLKPANILVTADAQVRLLDFGIAKLIEDDLTRESQLTRQGGQALTLDYASPEQIRGEPIGTASDVYSLAVVAYELLVGAKPYRLKQRSAAALEEAIAAVDVRLASVAAGQAARAALKGDLDAILNKALKKSAAERYPTVEAFAQDIERHLAHQPVQARPDARSYRLRKFVRRNQLPLAATAAVAIALLAGSALALWQARAARFEAAHAEQVKDFALSIVGGADTESGASAATTAVDLLQAAQLRVESELSAHPETAVELMTAVGNGLVSQGQLARAVDVLGKAVMRANRELGPQHPRSLAATVAYGQALVTFDRPKEAVDVLVPAVVEARRQGDSHAQVEALRWLSSAQFGVGDTEAGIASARGAVAALSSARGEVRKLDAFYAWASLSSALNFAQRDGQVDAARRALDLARAVYGERVTDNVLSARMLLAKGLSMEGQDAAAIDELSAVLADTIRFLGASHPRIEGVANFLGQARFDAGDVDGAIEAFRIELAAAERVAGGSGANRGIAHYALGKALAAARRESEALPHFEASVGLLGEAIGAAAPLTSRSHSARMLALTRLGQLDAAERGAKSLEDASWSGAEKAAHSGRVALLRSRQGRHDEAVALARSSVEGVSSHPSKIVRATASGTLGAVLLGADRAQEAVAPLREAVRLYAEKQLVMSPDRSEAIAALARAEAGSAPPVAALGKP